LKALLLAAGFGTRLRPITDNIPKCLLPINGKPLLEIWIDNLVAIGIDKIFINTHYLAEQVEDFINESKYKKFIEILYEPIILGTAGTLINNLDKFEDEDLLLIHADNYCLADLVELIYFHNNRPNNCLMTMLLFNTTNASKCGIVELNNKKIVIKFHEKVINPPTNIANAAIYIISNKLLKNLRNTAYKDFSTEIIPKLLGSIYTYLTDRKMVDIGTIDDYHKVNNI